VPSLAAAKVEGITDAEMKDAFDHLTQFMAGSIKLVNDNEVDRLTSKDDWGQSMLEVLFRGVSVTLLFRHRHVRSVGWRSPQGREIQSASVSEEARKATPLEWSIPAKLWSLSQPQNIWQRSFARK
jgi:hypothetical protein